MSLVSVLPLPDVSLPRLPVWVKWLWRAVMIVLIVLGVIGAVEKERDRDGSEDRNGG